MTHNHDDTPGAPDRSATLPRDLGDRLQRVLIASDQCAFTRSYLRLALAEEREALEQAGRVIFSQAFLAAGSAPCRSQPEELGARYHEALSEITLLAYELGKEQPAAEWFAEGQREAGYFSFALEQLADRLLEMAHTAPSPSLPDDGMLELVAAQCPEEPASMLVLRALSALELAVRLLDAAGMRLSAGLRLASEEGETADGTGGRVALAAILCLLLESQLRPALRALQSLDGRELASTKEAWAVGPGQALHTAAVELLEIEERLQIAVLSLSSEDLGTQPGAELSLEVAETSEVLNTTAKRLFEARDRLENQALPSLSSRAPAPPGAPAGNSDPKSHQETT